MVNNMKELDVKLLKYCDLIINNIEKKGLKRYDRVQIRFMPIFQKGTKLSNIARKIIGVLDIYFPILTRKILKKEKIILPTTYTHIANAYFIAEKEGINLNKTQNAKEILDLAINEYLEVDGKNYWWNYEKNEYFFPIDDSKRPTMHMHGLARINILLLKLSIYFNYPKYELISFNTLKTTINHHYISEKNGIKYISYYYNSLDCTINVNSEFAQWISMIPEKLMNEELYFIFKGVLRLILDEQNSNGMWTYSSKDHNTFYGTKDKPDAHHTATILYNLLNIYESKFITKSEKERIIIACNQGFEFFINNFFDFKSGKCYVYTQKKQQAGPVQYSEATFAMIAFIKNNNVNCEIKKNVEVLLDKVILQMVALVNVTDGSVPSEYFLHKWCNMDSIRWGNGPVLQAFVEYLALIKMRKET